MKRKVMIGLGAAALLALCFGPNPAFADDTAKQKLIVEMFKVMQYDRLTGQLASGAAHQIIGQFRARHPEAKKEVLDAIAETVHESFAVLTPHIARFSGDFMVHHFTTEELAAIVAFHKTPVGQKSMAVLPKMQQEMMTTLIPTMQSVQRDMTDRLRQRLQQFGYNL